MGEPARRRMACGKCTGVRVCGGGRVGWAQCVQGRAESPVGVGMWELCMCACVYVGGGGEHGVACRLQWYKCF